MTSRMLSAEYEYECDVCGIKVSMAEKGITLLFSGDEPRTYGPEGWTYVRLTEVVRTGNLFDGHLCKACTATHTVLSLAQRHPAWAPKKEGEPKP